MDIHELFFKIILLGAFLINTSYSVPDTYPSWYGSLETGLGLLKIEDFKKGNAILSEKINLSLRYKSENGVWLGIHLQWQSALDLTDKSNTPNHIWNFAPTLSFLSHHQYALNSLTAGIGIYEAQKNLNYQSCSNSIIDFSGGGYHENCFDWEPPPDQFTTFYGLIIPLQAQSGLHLSRIIIGLQAQIDLFLSFHHLSPPGVSFTAGPYLGYAF